MLYISKILKGMPDSRLLETYAADAPARVLMDKYVAHAQHDATLAVITLQSTCGELKKALSQLPPAEKITLLYEYLVSTSINSPIASAMLSSEAREQRKMKYWLVKSAVWMLGPIIFLVVGAAIAIGVRTGVMTDNPAFNSIISTAMEILKLIFTSAI